MSYEPLHHKYRPQTFAQLVGQEAIATTLSNALRQQRIAPAYLFTGPRGTGKTSSARILAKSLNCAQSEGPTDTPCGTCEICQTIARGSALDVIEIDAASNTGVDNIRELIERAQFAPVQCRYKVYIIDEVHMLSTAAFNALLKTLEEPPARVVFVLATTDPQRVLPTIISRCQRFDYRRIPLTAMVNHLMAIAQKEAIDVSPEAVELVAQIAQGGLRDAESLLDQLSLLAGQITVERVWDLVGAVPERDLLVLVRAIAQDDGTAVLDQARHLMNRGREPLIVLQNLASFYRDLLVAKTASDRRDLVTLTQPTWDALCEFAQTIDMPTILHGQQHLRESEVQVKNTTQPRLWLEITLMGLLPSALRTQPQQDVHPPRTAPSIPSVATPHPAPPTHPPTHLPTPSPTHSNTPQPPTLQPDKPQTEPERAIAPTTQSPQTTPEHTHSAQPPAAPPTTPSVPEPERPTSPLAESEGYAAFQQEKLDQIWRQVIAAMKPPGTQALLEQQGCLLGYDGRVARVGISSQPLIRMAQAKQANIEAAFEQVFGTKVMVSLEVGTVPSKTDTTGRKPSPVREATPLAPESASQPVASPAPPQPAGSPPPTHLPSGQPEVPSPAQPPAAYQSTDTTAASVNGNGVTPAAETVPPGSASEAAPPRWEAEDEVTRAAKSLAQMFNGQIVNLDDDDDGARLTPMSANGAQADPSGKDDTLPGQSPDGFNGISSPSSKNPNYLDDDVPF